MEKDTYRIARMIQKLGQKVFRSPFSGYVETIPEHYAACLGEPNAPDGAAYLACLFLAASVDRGQEDVVPLITHNQGGPPGVAGGPRSVAYWLAFGINTRFVDPEATALILRAWAWKRRQNPKPNRQPSIRGFSETPLGDPMLDASTDPILEIEQAIAMPGTLELPPPALAQLPQYAYAQVQSAVCLPPDSWARHPELVEQAIAAWGKIAPVVPLGVSRDVRTRAGWKFLERLIDHVDTVPRSESVLSLLGSDLLARREIRRIAIDRGLYRRGWGAFYPRVVDLDRRLAAIGV